MTYLGYNQVFIREFMFWNFMTQNSVHVLLKSRATYLVTQQNIIIEFTFEPWDKMSILIYTDYLLSYWQQFISLETYILNMN